MPQDTEFDLPFPLRVSTSLDASRSRNLEWVQQHGLAVRQESVDWYVSWDIPRLAAYGFPYAEGPELDLCADAMAFFFIFDDQFDGPLGQAPDRVAAVCQGFIDIVHGARPYSGHSPCSAAFADLWQRSTHRAPPSWLARAAHEWEYYFATHAHEAINRCRGVPTDMEQYLQVRRGIAATGLPLSLGERAAGISVPPAAFHSPQLRIMREIAVDITLMCNDVYSLEKEEARGDMDNLVLVIEHERRCSRAESVAAARKEVSRRCRRFQHLAREVPAMYAQLGLTPRQRAVVDAYIEVMTAWVSGYHAWETETLRYLSTESLPSSGPGYFEEVLYP
ncbi:terpene cyclase [Kitasatospora sp. NPDC059599]|uniref:terpene synthase family protein n=1 Tax=Kitasatospora sp. NPDC059599 TaxID=3346880 RepID=UPI0036A45D8F